MNYRTLGTTGLKISEVSLGTWQVGGGWGRDFDVPTAEKIIDSAVEGGVNFIDTADVYSDGRSEETVGKVVRRRDQNIAVATKCGRRISPHVAEGYTPKALRGFVEESLKNSGLERLDLIQLHCPPTDVYYRPEIFELFDRLKEEGKIANLGVSVEKVEEAQKAILYPNVKTVQIIFNMFRMRPREDFFTRAMAAGVGIIVRVPLASGLLSGKFTKNTTFAREDHRNFNRDGAAFDKGETFSGVPYDIGLEAVEAIKKVLPAGMTPAQAAIRWVLDHPAVSTVIPGASRPDQVASNIAVSDMAPLSPEVHARIDEIYETTIRKHVHHNW